MLRFPSVLFAHVLLDRSSKISQIFGRAFSIKYDKLMRRPPLRRMPGQFTFFQNILDILEDRSRLNLEKRSRTVFPKYPGNFGRPVPTKHEAAVSSLEIIR